MNLIELVNILKATGYPVAYSHFNEPAPTPFITYREVGVENLSADNKTYHDVKDIDIELYTDKKDLTAEQTLENILKENEIPFDATEMFIESEKLFQKIYEVRLI